MKAIGMFFLAVLVVKAAVAIAERPRPLFDAMHESGEAREASERNGWNVAFFADAVNRMRRAAIVWMAEILAGRNWVDTGNFHLGVEHGRGVQESRVRLVLSLKRTTYGRMSI